MARDRKRKNVDSEEEEDYEGEAEAEDDFDDDFSSEDENIDLDGDDVLDTDDFDDDAEEDAPVRAPPKRRPAPKKVPSIEGIAKSKLAERPDAAEEVWTKLRSRVGDAQPVPYSIREKLTPDLVIEHAKFGIGFVTEIQGPQKAEILFRDGLRKLAHNR
jgi:hypothetical protein